MDDDSGGVMHERSDLDLRALLAGVGVVATGIAIAVAVPWLFIARASAPASGPSDAAVPAVEDARRAIAAPLELQEFLREKNARLNAYGMDRDTGAVHIPIERAMELLSSATPAPKKGP